MRFRQENDLQNRFTVKRLCKPFYVCFRQSEKIVRYCESYERLFDTNHIMMIQHKKPAYLQASFNHLIILSNFF